MLLFSPAANLTLPRSLGALWRALRRTKPPPAPADAEADVDAADRAGGRAITAPVAPPRMPAGGVQRARRYCSTPVVFNAPPTVEFSVATDCAVL